MFRTTNKQTKRRTCKRKRKGKQKKNDLIEKRDGKNNGN